MPGLTGLALSGHRYLTAYTHAPLTLPAHASILTGLLPPTHGARGNGAFRLDATRITLAERLRSSGYRTAAFVGAFVLDPRFGLDQGFDRYEGVDDDRAFASDFGFAERRAPDVLAGAARWILDDTESGRPWFAWVHLFDPHAPYDAPGSAGSEPYDNEVRFTDRALTQFIERLRDRHLLGRTLMIVTADHGESLGEHGEKTHGLFAYDATMRVPLFIVGPGLGAAEHMAPAAHIDLVPTVLDVLGLPGDPALPGHSLRLDAAANQAVYVEAIDGWLSAGAAPITGIVQDGWKFVESPVPELYNLGTDPHETQNLYGAFPERQHDLEQRLRALESQADLSTPARRDPEVEARLRSLGYASSGPRKASRTFREVDDAKRVLPLYERFLGQLAKGGRDVKALLEILDERPSFEAARMVAASALLETGRAAEAVRLLEAVATSPGSSVAMRERLGTAYLASGRFDLAASIFKQIVTEPGTSADAWNGLGAALAQGGHPAEALQAFNQALGLAPTASRIRLNRTLAVLQTGHAAEALADLTELVAQQPRFLDGWRLLATLRHEQGDRAGAVEAWQRILAINPTDLDTLFNLAITFRDLGQMDQAREAATRFAGVAPRPAYNRELALLAALARP
jgi:arylsulfatase A-like enzyme/Flp pilus assembly protein TadD